MSEKIYLWLLRLYPSGFRKRYGEESLQLFRDRSREERGFFSKARLWLDLLADSAVALPREYRHAAAAFTGAPAHPLDGAPAFYIFEKESLRPGAVFLATMLAAAGLSIFAVLLNYGGKILPQHSSVFRPQPQPYALRPDATGSGTEPAAAVAAKTMKFATVLIRQGQPDAGATEEAAYTRDGYRQTNTPLSVLILRAYGVPAAEPISGEPEWVNSEKYRIEARVAPSDAAAFQHLDESQRKGMLQKLLEERFGLAAHSQTLLVPAYDLLVAENGPKLKADRPSDPVAQSSGGNSFLGAITVTPGKMVARSTSIPSLAFELGEAVNQPVLDATGLNGRYSFALHWAPSQSLAGTGAATPDEPSIFTALREQLGLKLTPTSEPAQFLVIDHVERPRKNE
jgi:uncharacterized protein (TIGR03435 family)